jgi:hypothetical protein
MKQLLLALVLPTLALAQQAPSPEAAALAKMREAMRGLTKRITEAEAAAANQGNRIRGQDQNPEF